MVLRNHQPLHPVSTLHTIDKSNSPHEITFRIKFLERTIAEVFSKSTLYIGTISTHDLSLPMLQPMLVVTDIKRAVS